MSDDERYREILSVTERLQKNIDTPSFWVVTNPTEHSTHDDIVFQSDTRSLILQVGGGLRNRDIFGIYKKKTVADSKGKHLLAMKRGCPVGQVYDSNKKRCIKKKR